MPADSAGSTPPTHPPSTTVTGAILWPPAGFESAGWSNGHSCWQPVLTGPRWRSAESSRSRWVPRRPHPQRYLETAGCAVWLSDWSLGFRRHATLGGEAAMPGMKVTVSAAMRARDVSRPQPQHEAAAEQNSPPARPRARAAPRPAGNGRDQAMSPVPPPAPRHRPPAPGPRPDGARPERGKGPRPGADPAPGSGPAPGTTAGTPGTTAGKAGTTAGTPGTTAGKAGTTAGTPGAAARTPGPGRPAAGMPRPAPGPAREPRQQESAPGREVPGAGRPDEARDPRGGVTGKKSERLPGDSGSGKPAATGRPAKRKRVRRRRSHGR